MRTLFTIVFLSCFIGLEGQEINTIVKPKDSIFYYEGPYFGLKPPGKDAELFAPGILSTEFHDDAAPMFYKQEVYFRIIYKKEGKYFGKIFCMKQINNKWQKPELASFSLNRMNGNMFISKNGQKIYFTINNGKEKEYNMDIVVTERNNDKWSNISLIENMNSSHNELSVFESNDSYLYWSSEKFTNDPKPKLFRTKIKNFNYSKKEEIKWFPDSALVDIINHEKAYAVYTMKTKQKSYDLFISFKTKDNTWSRPYNMGPSVNSKYMEKGARLSPDGKYIFFVSNRKHQNNNPIKLWTHPLLEACDIFPNADIYWVSTEIIKKLRPKK